MTGASVWTARRVRKRILCGRTSQGRYVCGGVLAQVIQGFRSKADGSSTDDPATMLDLSTLGVVALPEGFVEDPPGSAFWRPSSRPNRQRRELASWGSPPGRPHPDWSGTPPDFAHPAPWSRDCPRCGQRATVPFPLLWLVEMEPSTAPPVAVAIGRIRPARPRR